MKSTPEDFAYSNERLNEVFAIETFPGFTAEVCGKCKATANVVAGGSAWICPCGHINFMSWSNHVIPHQHPNYGPSLQRLHEAIALVRNRGQYAAT